MKETSIGRPSSAGKASAAGQARNFKQWNKGIGEAAFAIGQPTFPAMLETALLNVVSFEMMNGFAYSREGQAFDLYNERIVGDRTVIVDRYLAGSYILDPFYNAFRRHDPDSVLVMRSLAPDRFTDTEYFKRHYQATGIVDEIGIVLKLQHVDAILSLSRVGAVGAFSSRDVSVIEEVSPLVRALAEKHWLAHCHPMGGQAGAAATISHPLLSKREQEIVTLVLKGHSTYAIAAALGLSPNTVKVHRRQIYAKLKISSQVELFHLFLS